MDCAAIHERGKSKNLRFLVGGAKPHTSSFPPYSTNPSPRASKMIRLTAMETEFVKLASAVSLWQRSV